MSLSIFAQEDFSAGAFRGVARHLIPGNGAYSLQNYLLDEEDGSANKRGGSEYLSTSAFGSGGLRWVWDGLLVGGRRTVFADASDFAVLDAAEAPVNLGGAGLAAPVPFAVLGGVMFIGGGVIYAGSRKSADYSTGTVAVTNGSKTVTGTTTVWNTNADAGMLFQRGAGTRYYAVASVDSATQITLVDPYEGATLSGQTYTLSRLGTASAPYRSAGIYAAIGTRLLTGEGGRVYESSGWLNGVFRPHTFDANIFHEMPAGAEVLGIGQIGDDEAMVFTTAGVFVITQLSMDVFDDAANLQQTVQPVSPDVVLWGPSGLASWAQSLVVPAVDGVWLMGSDPPLKISLSITPLYVGYVRAGYRPGQAWVFRGHYFLPILNASNTVVDLLVCRLDRPIAAGRFSIWPWTWMRGHGANTPALTVRVAGAGVARDPKLLAAGADGRVLDVSGFFEPAAANAADADGTAPEYVIETRDYETGSGWLNTVIGLRVRYELEDAASDNPTIIGYISKGSALGGLAEWGTAEWGTAEWADATLSEFALLEGTASESTGRDPHPWRFAAKCRYVRARLRSSDPAARMALRALEWTVRLNGGRR